MVSAALDSPSPALSRARIALSDLELGESLGRGQFGEVFSATLHGTPVAVKKLHRNKLDEANLKAFRDEFELQLSLRHPNVLLTIGLVRAHHTRAHARARARAAMPRVAIRGPVCAACAAGGMRAAPKPCPQCSHSQ